MISRTIIVVGASRGIGRAIVERLSEDSANTILALSRNDKAMHDAFGSIKNVHPFAFDLEANVRTQLDKILEGFNQIDYMINNAGLLINKPYTELLHSDLERSFQVNVIGVIEAVQSVLPKMTKGHIINISSMGGFQGSVKFSGLTAYSTSKAALCSFTELFAEEFKESQLKMNCLCLGAVQTEMLAEAFPGYAAPLKPSEMAEFIVDFTLNGHRWMNGKIIPVSLSTP